MIAVALAEVAATPAATRAGDARQQRPTSAAARRLDAGASSAACLCRTPGCPRGWRWWRRRGCQSSAWGSKTRGGLVSGECRQLDGSSGSPVPYPVRPVALAGETVSGMRPEQTFDTYDALATALWPGSGRRGAGAERVDRFSCAGAGGGRSRPAAASRAVARHRCGSGWSGISCRGATSTCTCNSMAILRGRSGGWRPLLSSFDVTVANLEGNLSDTLAPTGRSPLGDVRFQPGDAGRIRAGWDRRGDPGEQPLGLERRGVGRAGAAGHDCGAWMGRGFRISGPDRASTSPGRRGWWRPEASGSRFSASTG